MARKSSSKKPSSRSKTASSRSKSSSSKSSSKRKSGSSRKYGPKAQKLVETEMRHYKKGEHKSPKQAIAIGLSKARRSGAKVPPRPRSSGARKVA